jgi:hypothetical protein
MFYAIAQYYVGFEYDSFDALMSNYIIAGMMIVAFGSYLICRR